MNNVTIKALVASLGVITCAAAHADEYRSFPMIYGLEAKPSADPTLLLGLEMQPAFTQVERSAGAADSSSEFSFQRLRTFIKGTATENIDYLLVTEWARNGATAPSDGGARAFRARATFRDVGDATNVAVGSIIVPFGHAFYVPAGTAPWVNYTRMTTTLYGCGSIDCTPDQDHTIANIWKTGVMAFDQINLGKASSLTYTAGVYNSSGTRFQDDGTQKDFNGSLEFHTGNVFAHYGVRIGSQKDANGVERDRERHAVVLRYNDYLRDRWWAWAEYMVGKDETAGADIEADGYEISLGYKFTDKWEGVVRYSEFDPNKDISGNDFDETSIGLIYRMDRGVRWQVQLDNVENAGGTVDDTVYTVRLTVPLGVKLK